MGGRDGMASSCGGKDGGGGGGGGGRLIIGGGSPPSWQLICTAPVSHIWYYYLYCWSREIGYFPMQCYHQSKTTKLLFCYQSITNIRRVILNDLTN